VPSVTDIIDTIASPPFASLQQVLDTNGPYGAGNHTLTQFATGGAFLLPAGTYDVGGTYGVIARVNGTIPPREGFKIGWSDPASINDESRYLNPIAQIIQQHLLPITGAYVTTTSEWMYNLQLWVPWQVLLGSGARVGLHIEPNWSLDLFYLCVL